MGVNRSCGGRCCGASMGMVRLPCACSARRVSGPLSNATSLQGQHSMHVGALTCSGASSHKFEPCAPLAQWRLRKPKARTPPTWAGAPKPARQQGAAPLHRDRLAKPRSPPDDRRASLGTAAAGWPSPATRPTRRGLDANVTKREDLGPRGRPRAANVTKREVFTARDPATRGRLQQKPRIRVGGGARGPLRPGSGAEKLRVLLHLHQREAKQEAAPCPRTSPAGGTVSL